MVTQRKSPKLSNEAKRVRAKIESLAPSDQIEFYKAKRPAFQELEEHEIRGIDRELLLAIANLHDAGWQRFFRKWMPRLGPKQVYELRDALRAIWERRPSEEQINAALLHWLRWSTRQNAAQYITFPWYPDVRTGRLMPDPRDLPVRLAMAVLAHFPNLRRCVNPDCVVSYFIAKRTSQRFCERGECTRYAQNQYALKWWREKQKSNTTTKKRRSKRGSTETR